MSSSSYCSRKIVENSIETFSFITDGHGLPEENVTVQFDPKLHCMTEDEATRRNIEELWTTRTKENPRLYNKSKFRLEDYHYHEETRSLTLKVGLTSYKDLQGTNLTGVSDQLVDHAAKDGLRFKKLSQAIGVGGWVVTSDKKFFLIKNALWKGEQGGKLDRPGGHPEPEEAYKDNQLPANAELTDIQVRTEIFSSEQKEIRDEINIPLDKQSKPELVGIVFNLAMGGRIGLEFKIDVDMTSEEVLQLYRSGEQAEADESTGLVFLDLKDVKEARQRLEAELTPHAQGSLRFLDNIVGCTNI